MLLNAFNITLTLPGIAGIILGIGMAVDANVIIFARVREEVTTGISVKTSLKNGFHKALSAIVDGNVTTLISYDYSLVQGFRFCKRICTDTGTWYCCVNVYGTCYYQNHHFLSVCDWSS